MRYSILVGLLAVSVVTVPAYYGNRATDDGTLKEILSEVKAIRRLMTPQSEHTLQSVITNRCAKCHTQGSEKGGVMLLQKDGKLPPFSTTELRLFKRVIDSGEMPKGGPHLTEPEKEVFR